VRLAKVQVNCDVGSYLEVLTSEREQARNPDLIVKVVMSAHFELARHRRDICVNNITRNERRR
jgi:hypothetical protein